MENLWVTLGKRRDDVRARGEALLRRGRETGIELLGRVEGGATRAQRTIATRRAHLNGKPIERLERRVLVRLEDVLDRMGLGLRTQMRRLMPGPTAPGLAAQGAESPADAEIVPSGRRAPGARATQRKRRIRVPVGEVTSATATSNGRAAPKAKKPTARRPTTRWVGTAGADLDALAALPAKQLASKVPALDLETCRALLAREKRQTKKRKTVLDALHARLS